MPVPVPGRDGRATGAPALTPSPTGGHRVCVGAQLWSPLPAGVRRA
jgi:hypothetical protein